MSIKRINFLKLFITTKYYILSVSIRKDRNDIFTQFIVVHLSSLTFVHTVLANK